MTGIVGVGVGRHAGEVQPEMTLGRLLKLGDLLLVVSGHLVPQL